MRWGNAYERWMLRGRWCGMGMVMGGSRGVAEKCCRHCTCHYFLFIVLNAHNNT